MTEATAEPQEKVFTVGDHVSWESSANGITKKKKGVVAVAVPHNMDPHQFVSEGFRLDADGGPRDHESYLVQVGDSKELFWPRVSKLAAAKAPKVPKEKKPKKEPLQVGKTSITVDGKEIVFNRGQSELPGMPEIARYRRLADAFILQQKDIETELIRLGKIKNEIMLELKNTGRSEFAFRKGEMTYQFSIVPTDEKIKVSKKK